MLIIKAPAKINLFLSVVGKRKDGYHNIVTVFLKIRLFDKLYFKKADSGIKISCNKKEVPVDSTNLVYKAAGLLQEFTGTNFGANIRIIKKIPVAAGLGGGSSDAAAALIGLNQLWNLRLDRETLLRLGKKIGADVPLFLLPETLVLGTARGDKLKPLKLRKEILLVLVNPGIPVSTKAIYEGLSSCLTKKVNDVKLLTHALEFDGPDKIEKYLFNQLEEVTFNKYKRIKEIKKIISAFGFKAVLMSGSGSIVFCVVKNREEATRIKRGLVGLKEILMVRSL